MRLELTRRSDYAIRGALTLARNPGQTLSGAQIAERTQIPVRFVTQVMGYLVRAGLVRAVIGRSGGYVLAAAPAKVSVLQIVEAVEGDSRRLHCALRGGACQRSSPCEIHHVFSAAQEAFISELASESLATVAASEPAGPAGLNVSRKSSGASRDKRRPARGAEG